ncbi:hypothetical protein FVB43_08555 [Erwinia rhapontici]|uniref:hypothetical protein n=1 Tax=Erwinia rhapontici TaxID=55212 RepID=UPI0014383B3E|nr:hypothetical protein [Erwinia rhapontici]NKG30090.1 hypothetical protein [Erwinia rhapontici]
METDNNLSIYISIGGFFISCLGFVNTLRQASITRRNEKLRVYDKVYFDVCDLLLYDYKLKTNTPYVSEDKTLERAVNEYEKLHWLEQHYGPAKYDYVDFESSKSLIEFHRKVADEYRVHNRSKVEMWDMNQSPVMHLDKKDFLERFDRVMGHVKENISFFSPFIRTQWEKAAFMNPDNIKAEYESLKRVNEYSCEEFQERVDDPFLNVFLFIRSEHRILNQTQSDKFGEFFYNLKYYFPKKIYKWKKKRKQRGYSS